MLRTKASNHEAVLKAIGRSQAVIEFQPDGTIISANENFCAAMGYSLDEIRGRHHSMFVDPGEQGHAYKAFWDDLRRGEFKTGEFRRLAKGGREIWIQGAYNPIVDRKGRTVKVVKVVSDITEQKLRNADYIGQLQAISKSQAVIEFELDGTIITANPNFCSAMGYELSEIQGKHHRMFVEAGTDRKPEYAAFWDRLRRGEFAAGEFKRFARGGREIWIQASYNPILDPSGRPFKVVKCATDITDMVRRRQESERIAGLVDQALEKITSAVSSTSQQSAMAASAAVETSSTVQAVASAASQFDASAQEIARSMSSSRAAVERTMNETRAADDSTKALTRAAEAMNGIVEIIQTIAGQINLLALNATIESARAGEAGKGFAVVATEVKNLANQVAAAIGQISGEISNVQTVSGDVVERLRHIQEGVAAVQESVTIVASAIEEQSAASQEITANMNNAATAVGDISASLEQINLSVGSAKSYAEEGITLYRSLQAA